MLWRVHPRTVNPVPRGKHSRFDSVDLHQNPDFLGRKKEAFGNDVRTPVTVGGQPYTVSEP